MFLIVAAENKARRSISWVDWSNWSTNKEGKCRYYILLVFICSL